MDRPNPGGPLHATNHQIAWQVFNHTVLILVTCYYVGKNLISDPTRWRGMAITIVGICPERFEKLTRWTAAARLIHEALHTAGMTEQPPTQTR